MKTALTVKAGDEVACFYARYRDDLPTSYTKMSVVRVTASGQIVAFPHYGLNPTEYRFNADGSGKGAAQGWQLMPIEGTAAEAIEAHELAEKLCEADWHSMDSATLREAVKLLEG